MNPFQYLGNEHRELTQVLEVLESMTDAVAAGVAIDRLELQALVDFFREFGDMAHHDKEETLLVPALIRHHMDWYDGPVAELRRDHRQERYLMRSLRDAARQTQQWSEEDKRHFVSIARSYSEFMREHMQKESDLWFAEAASKLPPQEQAELVRSFEKFDAELNEMPDFRAIRERARELVEKHRKQG